MLGLRSPVHQLLSTSSRLEKSTSQHQINDITYHFFKDKHHSVNSRLKSNHETMYQSFHFYQTQEQWETCNASEIKHHPTVQERNIGHSCIILSSVLPKNQNSQTKISNHQNKTNLPVNFNYVIQQQLRKYINLRFSAIHFMNYSSN